MSPHDARQYLDSFINYESRLSEIDPKVFKLARVREVLKNFGDPQKRLKIIHVAGTSGKGSTCAVTASILRAAGYRTGLYTSPHLFDYTERIRVLDAGSDEADDIPGTITEEELSRLVSDGREAIEKVRLRREELGRLSFFEVYTVLALFHFARSQAEFAVLETGLGGRLDATNVTESLVCGITPINLEHTHILGSTLAEIAAEKAAIIKDPRQTAVIAPQHKEAETVIRRRSEEIGAKILWLGADIRYEVLRSDIRGQEFTLRTPLRTYPDLQSTLLGPYQAMNISTAVGLVESLAAFGYTISQDDVREGVRAARWPGRLEIVRQKPLTIVDGAHHPAAITTLVETFQKILSDRKVTVVLGCSRDKDVRGICRNIGPLAARIILTRSRHPRAWDFAQEDLKEFFPSQEIIRTDSVSEALHTASEITSDDGVVLVTGSIFVIAEARKLCIS